MYFPSNYLSHEIVHFRLPSLWPKLSYLHLSYSVITSFYMIFHSKGIKASTLFISTSTPTAAIHEELSPEYLFELSSLAAPY